MKKELILGVLAVLAATDAMAQSPVALQPEHVTIYSAASSYVGEYDFVYDEFGAVLGLSMLGSGDSWYTCRYDEQMRLKECEIDCGRNYSELHQFEYRDGKLSQTLEWFHDPHNNYYWEPRHKWIPVYDNEGRIVGDSLFWLVGYPPGHPMLLRWTSTITYEDSQEITVWSESYCGVSTQKRMTKNLDDTGRTTSLLTEQMINGSYANVTIDEYHYTNGFLSSVETKNWEQQEWVNYQEVVYSRDASGWILTTTYRSWNGTEYVDGRRTLYERNNEGYPTSLVFQTHTTDGWTEGSNPIYNPYASLPSRFRDTLFNNHEHLAIQQQILGTGHAAIKRIDITYTSTPYPTYSVPDKVDSSISCVPNPTKGQFLVSGTGMTKVEVFNLLGERLIEMHCTDETTIDLGKQPSGMYLITVTNDRGQQHTQKVVKE